MLNSSNSNKSEGFFSNIGGFFNQAFNFKFRKEGFEDELNLTFEEIAKKKK
jgi:hypothetical protein